MTREELEMIIGPSPDRRERMKAQEYNIKGAGGLVGDSENTLEIHPGGGVSYTPALKETVNHPQHYNNIPNIECIDIVEHMNFNLGNVIKYIWRHDSKNGLEDLKKAQWYLNREIERLEKETR